MRHLIVRALGLVLIASMFTVAASTQPAAAAPGIRAKLVKGGLNDPAGFTFGPGGLIYYLERGTGRLLTLNPSNGRQHLVFTISGVDGQGERGALGVALHPRWPQVPYVYAYVTRMANGALRNQLLRIHVANGQGTGFQVLFQSPASGSPYHNGGRILFGPGGDLFAFIGDGHVDANGQDRSANLQGKMLRINPDGSIPAGNPFSGSRIWTYGNRNSFGFTFDPRTRRLWETENGPNCNDEINLLVRGGNYGWGANENCNGSSPGDTNNSGPRPRHFPKVFFKGTIGITGDAFCDHCGLPPRFGGKLFFGCVNDGKLRVATMNVARNGIKGVTSPLTVSGGIYSMETSPKGQIFFSNAGGIYRLVTG
jgi:glucose/arabinose dehydrogenase